MISEPKLLTPGDAALSARLLLERTLRGQPDTTPATSRGWNEDTEFSLPSWVCAEQKCVFVSVPAEGDKNEADSTNRVARGALGREY